jgi:hypothetical protein
MRCAGEQPPSLCVVLLSSNVRMRNVVSMIFNLHNPWVRRRRESEITFHSKAIATEVLSLHVRKARQLSRVSRRLTVSERVTLPS